MRREELIHAKRLGETDERLSRWGELPDQHISESEYLIRTVSVAPVDIPTSFPFSCVLRAIGVIPAKACHLR
jgi:hypothetical protein